MGRQPQGQSFPPQGGYYPSINRSWNVLCIIGFVLSFLLPPVGLVLSIIALVQINRSFQKSKGLSIAGIVIGALGTLLCVMLIGMTIWLFSNLTYSDNQVCFQGTCSDYSDMDTDTFASTHQFTALPWNDDTQK